MKLFILLDISGSMEGAKIGALNDSMSNIIMTLQESSVGEGSSGAFHLDYWKNSQMDV